VPPLVSAALRRYFALLSFFAGENRDAE
jgi:hypothetical protein